MDTGPYRKISCSLIYFSRRMRLYIVTAVLILGKFQTEPSPKYWKEYNNLLRYIKDTVDYGVLITSKGDCHLLKYWSDVYWVRYGTQSRSRSCVLIFYHVTPVVWLWKLQTATAIYNSEAKFSSLSLCVGEVNWLQIVLSVVGCG